MTTRLAPAGAWDRLVLVPVAPVEEVPVVVVDVVGVAVVLHGLVAASITVLVIVVLLVRAASESSRAGPSTQL